MVKLGFEILPLTDETVASHLAMQTECFGSVMLDFASRRGRRHLKLHRDQTGYFVRTGRRGANKQYLGQCKVTWIDGSPTLFAYTLAEQDAFEEERALRRSERREAP
jgi:hypothetical protein